MLLGLFRFFTEDYAKHTIPVLHQLGQSQDLPILSEYESHKHIPQERLSSTETGRLQRALCRFEVYRCLFSRCLQDLQHDPHQCSVYLPLTTAKQAKVFFQHLPAFQIDEIACIRDYLFRRLRGIYNELEDEAVRTLPVETMTFKRYNESAMSRSPFYLFTTHARQQEEDHLEHLMSLGLPYIRRVLESSGDEQRGLFLHRVPDFVVDHLERHFLSKTLQCIGLNPNVNPGRYPWLEMGEEFKPASDENGYSEIRQGWLWGHCHLEPSRLADPA